MDKKPEFPSLHKVVESLLKGRGSSLAKASLKMGRASNYLTIRLKSNNPNIGLLVDLSNLVGINLLEAYLPFMAPEVRHTAVERELMQQLAAKNAELETVKTERDKYWGLLEKRGG